MKRSSEEHNRLYGYGLTVVVMDFIRDHDAKGTVVTLWSMARDLGTAAKVHGMQRERLYARIRTTVDNLENSGMVTTRREYDHEQEKWHKIITLCRS